MLKKGLSMAVAGAVVLWVFGFATAIAKTKEEKAAEFSYKVKSGITQLGVGPEARVKVTLRNKVKLTGFVREAGENSFVLVEDKSNLATEVGYQDVAKVKGNNLHTGAVVAISAGVAVGVVFLILWLLLRGD